jgi:hypothetical protein
MHTYIHIYVYTKGGLCVHDLSILNTDTKETSLLTLSALFQSDRLTVSSVDRLTVSSLIPSFSSVSSLIEPLRVTQIQGGEKGSSDINATPPNNSISSYSIKYPKKIENLSEELLDTEQRGGIISSILVENSYGRKVRLLPVSNLPIVVFIGDNICICIYL